MKVNSSIIKLVALFSIPALLTSCASGGLRKAQTEYRSGSIAMAKNSINGLAAKEKEGARDSELVFVEQGNILATNGDAVAAKEAFIKGDRSITKHDQSAKIQLGNEAGALLVNLNSLPYRTSPSERLMASTYLATAFLQNNDLTAARSAIKLTKNRQAEIFAQFQKQIDKEKATLQQAINSDPKTKIQIETGKIDNETAKLQMAADKFTPYKDLSVPYSEAISGVILGFGANPESARAAESFTHALSAHPNAAFLKKAIGASPSGTTHVFIEDGVSPELGSFRFDLPIYINGAFTTLSAAFPTFQPAPMSGALSTLKIGGNPITPDVICDFDRIAASEFKRKLPGTIAKTMASSTLKAAAGIAGQIAAKQSGGDYGNSIASAMAIGSTIYNVASAQADQRIWSTLPKQVRYACASTPAGGSVEVGGKSIKLPANGSNLVIARVINGQVFLRAIAL